jgi:hypothetical protein
MVEQQRRVAAEGGRRDQAVAEDFPSAAQTGVGVQQRELRVQRLGPRLQGVQIGIHMRFGHSCFRLYR